MKKHKKQPCPTGKIRYRDHAEAVRALHKAVNQRHWALIDGVECHRGECRDYPCPMCKGYHLTSQPLRSSLRLAA